jgi:hypothetical protein
VEVSLLYSNALSLRRKRSPAAELTGCLGKVTAVSPEATAPARRWSPLALSCRTISTEAAVVADFSMLQLRTQSS